jgi:hypothetical protein
MGRAHKTTSKGGINKLAPPLEDNLTPPLSTLFIKGLITKAIAWGLT